jgi:hypothetical protein
MATPHTPRRATHAARLEALAVQLAPRLGGEGALGVGRDLGRRRSHGAGCVVLGDAGIGMVVQEQRKAQRVSAGGQRRARHAACVAGRAPPPPHARESRAPRSRGSGAGGASRGRARLPAAKCSWDLSGSVSLPPAALCLLQALRLCAACMMSACGGHDSAWPHICDPFLLCSWTLPAACLPVLACGWLLSLCSSACGVRWRQLLHTHPGPWLLPLPYKGGAPSLPLFSSPHHLKHPQAQASLYSSSQPTK